MPIHSLLWIREAGAVFSELLAHVDAIAVGIGENEAPEAKSASRMASMILTWCCSEWSYSAAASWTSRCATFWVVALWPFITER